MASEPDTLAQELEAENCASDTPDATAEQLSEYVDKLDGEDDEDA